MNPSRTLKIYIASSFRNLHAEDLLMDRLRDAGHSVLDWTTFAPPLPAAMRPEERRNLLDSDSRGQIFDFCTSASAVADLVIYLGESGQDAACEVGIAFNAGVPVIGLSGPLEALGLILSRAVSAWYTKASELLAAVERIAEGKGKYLTCGPVCRECGHGYGPESDLCLADCAVKRGEGATCR